jgi:hypothetical protein
MECRNGEKGGKPLSTETFTDRHHGLFSLDRPSTHDLPPLLCRQLPITCLFALPLAYLPAVCAPLPHPHSPLTTHHSLFILGALGNARGEPSRSEASPRKNRPWKYVLTALAQLLNGFVIPTPRFPNFLF